MSITLDPLKLFSLPLIDRQQLPSCTAIYIAIDSQDRVLYVGKAKNLVARWRNHHRLYKLEEINRGSPVRIAWQAWDPESLDEVEKSLIANLHPLLNNTEVETPAVIPSEVILRDFLKTFSRRLIIFGIKPETSETLLNVYLKYDPSDYSAKGTAAKIKEYIQKNKDKNTSLKFKHRKWYKDFSSFSLETLRPGSRAQRTIARQYQANNNHWEFACNGVIMHITPESFYREYRNQTEIVKLAGINCRAVTQEAFTAAQGSNYHALSKLSCFVSDPVPLLWMNWYALHATPPAI